MRFGAVKHMHQDNGHANDNPAHQVNLGAVSAQAAGFFEQAPVGELAGAKLSRLLDGFLHSEVLPQAGRAADQGIDPTPLLAVTAEVLRLYADASTLMRSLTKALEAGLARRSYAGTSACRRAEVLWGGWAGSPGDRGVVAGPEGGRRPPGRP